MATDLKVAQSRKAVAFVEASGGFENAVRNILGGRRGY